MSSLFFDAFASASSNGSTSSPIYTAQDLVGLNILERWWSDWYIRIGDPAIATNLLVFLVHEIVYFGRALPFIAMDHVPYFRQWKLQPNRMPTLAKQLECTKLILVSHIFIELPLIFGFHSTTSYFGLESYQVPFPSWQKVALQIALFFLFEDTAHYFLHRAFHTPRLYKAIHKVHHEYPAPFALTAEYAHPAETLILGMGTMGGPIAYCACTGDLHLFTVLLWMSLRLCQAVSSHSGYDFPWGLRHVFPLWAGAEHHDYHHARFVDNFSSSFRHWDALLGTDTRYRAYKARIDAAKADDKQMVRKAEDQQAEMEGFLAAADTILKAGVDRKRKQQ